MDYIDYDEWVDVIEELVEPFKPGNQWLDISCGTASMAIRLANRGKSITAVDISSDMIAVASEKAQEAGTDIKFQVGDMRDWGNGQHYDVVINLHDGLNYLLEEADFLKFMLNAHALLKPGGVMICDVATPLLCQRHFKGYHEMFADEVASYERITSYDPHAQLAETKFQINAENQTVEIELHIQKAYSLDEVKTMLKATPFNKPIYIDDDTLEAADEDTERLVLLLQKAP
jgi:ubiquinone/menaquinone biosynthesis C-methylase UbiE